MNPSQITKKSLVKWGGESVYVQAEQLVRRGAVLKADMKDDWISGVIAREPRGAHGFGFDPVFSPYPTLYQRGGGAPDDLPEHSATLGELSDDFKNSISHRAQAAQKLRPILEQIARS